MPSSNSKTNPAAKPFSLIPHEKLLTMYAALLKCHMLTRHIRGSRKPGQAFLAPAVGITSGLLPGDTLKASGPDTLARIVKGASLKTILKSFDPASRHSSGAAIIRSAMRAAVAHKAERKKKVAVAFCGDPSATHEMWHHALREASSKRLPILFICHAAGEATEKIPHAPDFLFPAIVVDAHDVIAIYRVASEALTHARRGNGPTLIVCQPFCPATGEAASAKDCDPIPTMEKYLESKGLSTAAHKAKTMADFTRALRATVSTIE